MEEERNERRKETEQKKAARKAEQAKLLAAGNPGDVDFIGMVQEWREEQEKAHIKQPHYGPETSSNGNIIVAVRKRPISSKELQKKDHDSVSCFHPKVWIHSAKFRVDGITKYLTHTGFQFDHAFGEVSTTDEIYIATTMPLLDHVVSTQGRATCFCYGMTGSGKTYTMSAIQQILAHDLYEELKEKDADVEVTLAFFELYGGFVQDLLHDRKRCKLLEDGKGEVNITGLQEVTAHSVDDFLRIISEGHSQRTTHTTEANDCSSRSHAICQVFLRDTSSGDLKGKLTLVDLAGSERGSDTKSHNSQRRAESAEINTSLLSLKECIRALGQKNAHVPYRGSKLTLILKDCFSHDSKTTMIATVSPGASATDHSLNTLRYADRIKEQRVSSCDMVHSFLLTILMIYFTLFRLHPRLARDLRVVQPRR
jgi:kinesin family member 2/24